VYELVGSGVNLAFLDILVILVKVYQWQGYPFLCLFNTKILILQNEKLTEVHQASLNFY
jgi:hypothetical protein